MIDVKFLEAHKKLHFVARKIRFREKDLREEIRKEERDYPNKGMSLFKWIKNESKIN